MSKPTEEQFSAWVDEERDYVFVETGCHHGHTLHKAANIFTECHSIEIDQRMYKAAIRRFSNSLRVTVHLGTSEALLGPLVSQICKPILFWLDAHGAPGAQCGGYVPLITELAVAIAHGDARDVIAIDDTICFGRDDSPVKGDDWTAVTMEKIEGMLEAGGFTARTHHKPNMDSAVWHRSGILVAKRT